MEQNDRIILIFPHQLFEEHPILNAAAHVVLVEEYLFFRQYAFHKQKIVHQRATMRAYHRLLQNNGKRVRYVDSYEDIADVRLLIPRLAAEGVKEIHHIDVVDDWLEKRLKAACAAHGIVLVPYETHMFLNSLPELERFFNKKKRFYQTEFYMHQRKDRGILLEPDGKHPIGGKWSFDAENRKKIPAREPLPQIDFPDADEVYKEAVAYTERYFAENVGQISTQPIFPYDHERSRSWLRQFFERRFDRFGVYEDAVRAQSSMLFHSVLTPMLNTGLLTPAQVVQEAIHFAEGHAIPLNSLEGFVRQIIGWREFMRALYELKGVEARTKNFWGFTRKIPATFWTGDTGIVPVDNVIKKALRTSYSNHIERLMVMGNFMLLCEFHPDEVYRWFMEMYIDAYDWVMVPNVYSMSQYADGGIMATKPYIGASNYLFKMSDFKKGPWSDIWDGLFWRFMHVSREVLAKNRRMQMLLGVFDRFPEKKRQQLLKVADDYLEGLDRVM